MSRVFPVRHHGGATVPAPAAYVGYNTRTFGPHVTLASNWYTVSGASITQNSDGSATINSSPNAFNYTLQTATGYSTGGGGAFTGNVFGGGGYFEATFKFTGTVNTATGWPSFWSNDIELQGDASSGSVSHWDGQASNYFDWIEVDFCEFATNGSNLQYGMAMHNWYSTIGSAVQADAGSISGSPTTLPGGTDTSQYHKYGFLWVPATGSSNGYGRFYFDRSPIGNTINWLQYNRANGPPPVVPAVNGANTAFSVLDRCHLVLILGTSSNNPMTISSVEVWQATAANNITH